MTFSILNLTPILMLLLPDHSMDLELGHVNHQVGPNGKAGIREISGVNPRPTPPATNVDELKALADADFGSTENNVVGWHYDRFVPCPYSYPPRLPHHFLLLHGTKPYIEDASTIYVFCKES